MESLVAFLLFFFLFVILSRTFSLLLTTSLSVVWKYALRLDREKHLYFLKILPKQQRRKKGSSFLELKLFQLEFHYCGSCDLTQRLKHDCLLQAHRAQIIIICAENCLQAHIKNLRTPKTDIMFLKQSILSMWSVLWEMSVLVFLRGNKIIL